MSDLEDELCELYEWKRDDTGHKREIVCRNKAVVKCSFCGRQRCKECQGIVRFKYLPCCQNWICIDEHSICTQAQLCPNCVYYF
jgi:hypothetical protein